MVAKIVNAAPDATYPAYQLFDGTVVNDLTTCIDALLLYPTARGLPLPAWAYFCCGVNDANNFTTGEGLFGRIQGQVDRLLAAGIKVILETITPAGGPGGFGTSAYVMAACNRRLFAYYGRNKNVLIFDTYRAVLDQTELTASDYPTQAASFSVDGTHYSSQGSVLLGRSHLAPLLQTQYPFNSPVEWLTSNHYDVFDATVNPYGNRWLNPFWTGTTGTKIPGTGTITGNMPTSWALELSGAATGSCPRRARRRPRPRRRRPPRCPAGARRGGACGAAPR